MGEVVPFPLHRTREEDDPELQSLYSHPARSSQTPPLQSGLPALLFAMPDGEIVFHATPLGLRVLRKAVREADLPFSLVSSLTGGLVAKCLLSSPTSFEVFDLCERLGEWFVLHGYQGRVNDFPPHHTYSFTRLLPSPLSSVRPYLWTLDFGPHGDTWAFGTPDDLSRAMTELSANSLVSVLNVSEPDSLAGFSVESRRRDLMIAQLAKAGFWVRADSVWCSCH